MATNFKEQFDGKYPALESAIESMAGGLDRAIPGLDKHRLRRFLQRFGVLLGRLDNKGARHPVYLAYGSPNLPSYLLSFLDNVPSHAANGPAYFAQNALPQLVDMQLRLERAIGVESSELEELRSTAAADIRSTLVEAEQTLEKTQAARDGVLEKEQQVTQTAANLAQQVVNATKDADTVREIRAKAEKIASSDGRTAGSIEKLMRTAQSKLDGITALHEEAATAAGLVAEQSSQVSTVREELETTKEKIDGIAKRADEVLLSATQAGLAASYIQERKRLQSTQLIYTIVFYTAILIMAAVAALYVLPALEKVVSAQTDHSSLVENALIMLIRVGVLAPFVWAIVFTSQRVHRVEMLQLDYAEKAAASLAYSGYKGEMDADPELLKKLKDGLLLRFSEHPERLLQKHPPTAVVHVSDEGFSATTESPSGD